MTDPVCDEPDRRLPALSGSLRSFRGRPPHPPRPTWNFNGQEDGAGEGIHPVPSCRMIRWPTPTLTALFIFCTLATPASASPGASDRILHLHRGMDAGGFFKLKELDEPIDFSDIDHALLAAAVFHETNRRRTGNDLPALRFMPELREAARIQSRDMRRRDEVSHRGSEPSIRSLDDRLEKVGLSGRFRAENVAMVFGIRYEPGSDVHTRKEGGRTVFSRSPGGPAIEPHSYRSFAKHLLDSWMDSPGHRRNILRSEASALGTACIPQESNDDPKRFFCTQVFFTPFPFPPAGGR